MRCYLCLDEFLLPGEDGDGIVPNRSDYDAGKIREPPDLLPRKRHSQRCRHLQSRLGRNRIEGQQTSQ
jgi:hypothetical protein